MINNQLIIDNNKVPIEYFSKKIMNAPKYNKTTTYDELNYQKFFSLENFNGINCY